MRVVPTRQMLRSGTEAQPPADLFVPTQREALLVETEPEPDVDRTPGPEPEPDPLEASPAPSPAPKPSPRPRSTAAARPAEVKRLRVRSNGLLPVATVAVLLSGLLGVVTVGALGDRAGTQDAPPAAAPNEPLGDVRGSDGGYSGGYSGVAGTDPAGIAVLTMNTGTPVTLPGPSSLDWVAPGVSSDGSLVRAELPEEWIEFRAANTQPGLPGAFQVSWSGARLPYMRGDAGLMLGVRPGGWVEFIVRPLSSPADLVMHLSGNDVAVTVGTQGGSTSRVLSAPAAAVVVTLPAGTAATVMISPAGNRDIGVVTAELR